MKPCFILNPNSGHNRRNLPAMRALLRRCAPAGSLFLQTERQGHAIELARQALEAGHSRIVAVGGDGTLNEVASALVGTGADLGLVPCGSGNGLALHLGIPVKPEQAALLAGSDSARIHIMDTGVAAGHPFFNATGLGLDADISAAFNRLSKRGFPAYVRTTIRTWLRHRPVRCTIATEDGRRLSTEALLVCVANSDQYGNNALIAPGARVDDGLLDLTVIGRMSMPRLVWLARRLFNGTLPRSAAVRTLRARGFTIEREAPGLLHTDGEHHEAGERVEISVRPASLRIVTP